MFTLIDLLAQVDQKCCTSRSMLSCLKLDSLILPLPNAIPLKRTVCERPTLQGSVRIRCLRLPQTEFLNHHVFTSQILLTGSKSDIISPSIFDFVTSLFSLLSSLFFLRLPDCGSHLACLRLDSLVLVHYRQAAKLLVWAGSLQNHTGPICTHYFMRATKREGKNKNRYKFAKSKGRTLQMCGFLRLDFTFSFPLWILPARLCQCSLSSSCRAATISDLPSGPNSAKLTKNGANQEIQSKLTRSELSSFRTAQRQLQNWIESNWTKQTKPNQNKTFWKKLNLSGEIGSGNWSWSLKKEARISCICM